MVYKAYREYCERVGEISVSQRRFSTALMERGCRKVRSGGVWYHGLAVTDD